jgi:hypothetical protein
MGDGTILSHYLSPLQYWTPALTLPNWFPSRSPPDERVATWGLRGYDFVHYVIASWEREG